MKILDISSQSLYFYYGCSKTLSMLILNCCLLSKILIITLRNGYHVCMKCHALKSIQMLTNGLLDCSGFHLRSAAHLKNWSTE